MKADLTSIETIIFDLGKVLLNLDFDASIRAFRELGSQNALLDHKNAYADPIFYQLEVGEITPSVFRDGLRRLLNNPNANDEQLDAAWNSMILDIPEKRVKKLQELGSRYPIFLFSNTNQLHVNKLLKEFKQAYGIEFPSLFQKTFYSHELHDRKPELSSFEKVIELAGCTPARTLFVDDLEKNIEAARKAGLQTLWLQDGLEMAELF